MPSFKCFIHGKNFPGILIGETDDVGFYTTRFVQATDSAAAEMTALEMLRSDPKLSLPSGCQPSPETRVFFESIDEVDAGDVPDVQPGFAWYSREDEAT